MIDFSGYVIGFKEFCNERGIIFKSQEQADQYYCIWNAGFQWAREYFY